MTIEIGLTSEMIDAFEFSAGECAGISVREGLIAFLAELQKSYAIRWVGPHPDVEIRLARTNYAPGIPNRWKVEADAPLHSTSDEDLAAALMWVRILAERIEREQVHR